MERNIVQNV